jgi:3-isopropylmalate/(R)-2-methylmalate dehydratase small subunit
MKPFRLHDGLTVPLDQPNIDTDQIIPKQFLKRIERTGFGAFLFHDWRYLPNGNLNQEFILNAARYSGASILLAAKNFGCGSSREHAPWALEDFGIRVIIAPSFADIFANNCIKIGLLPVVLKDTEVTELLRRTKDNPGYRLIVDLETCEVRDNKDFRANFVITDFKRHCLLHGLDHIGLSLRHESEIATYEVQIPEWSLRLVD